MFLVTNENMGLCLYMLTLQSPSSQIVCLLIFKVNQGNLDDVILLASQGVSSTDVQEGLIVCYLLMGCYQKSLS